MSNKILQSFDKSQGKNLIDVNPNVTGLKVVIALLVHSLIGAVMGLVVIYHKERKSVPKGDNELLENV
ncbi:hypothetical protein BDD12DRAFT_892061 [Trichophaea hybrida]|nr:hypothetical protein BDD12DRAFT_892061 [Trichophaea hybrida]